MSQAIFDEVKKQFDEQQGTISLEKIQTACTFWEEPDTTSHEYESWDIDEQLEQVSRGSNQSEMVYKYQLMYPKKQGGKDKGRLDFNRIFENLDQESIYDSYIAEYVTKCFAGSNFSVVNFGAFGSGKTYSLLGSTQLLSELKDFKNNKFLSDEAQESYGIFPRTFFHIYDEIEILCENQKAQNRSSDEFDYKIEMSILEVHNDQLNNLLGKKLDYKNIIDFSSISKQVKNQDQFFSYLGKALKRAHFKEKDDGYLSSKSHMIYSLNLIQTSHKDKLQIAGRVTFVDLANYEQNDSKLSKQVRDENNNIRLSLFHLNQVMHKLKNADYDHISYNNSKLTKCLKNIIGGNSSTICMICCSRKMSKLDQTLKCFKLASSIKNVQNQPMINLKTFKQIQDEEKRKRKSLITTHNARMSTLRPNEQSTQVPHSPVRSIENSFEEPELKNNNANIGDKTEEEEQNFNDMLEMRDDRTQIKDEEQPIASKVDSDSQDKEDNQPFEASNEQAEQAASSPDLENQDYSKSSVKEDVKPTDFKKEEENQEQPDLDRSDDSDQSLKEDFNTHQFEDKQMDQNIDRDNIEEPEQKEDQRSDNQINYDSDDKSAHDFQKIDKSEHSQEEQINDPPESFIEDKHYESHEEDSSSDDEFNDNQSISLKETIMNDIQKSQSGLLQSSVRKFIKPRRLTYAKVFKKIVNQRVFGAYNSTVCLAGKKEKGNITNLLEMLQHTQDKLQQEQLSHVPEFHDPMQALSKSTLVGHSRKQLL